MNEYLKEKVNFVKGLEQAVLPVQPNIVAIHYDVFASNKNPNWTNEYLVVEYKGGAKSARNCNMNSCSAIYAELAPLLTSWCGGKDVEYYNEECLEKYSKKIS